MTNHYLDLLTELYHSGKSELNARTGVNIKMIRGGCSFKLDLLDGRLPVPGNRRYFPHVAAAEVAWQFMGTRDPAFILSKAPKLWSKFVETELVDSETNPTGKLIGVLKTAYGYRWRKAFGRDQLSLAIEELTNNPTNRQLWIQAWDPRCDGLGGPQPKNIPCPIGFTLSRFENELHMSVFIRSSDVFVGLPYDVMGYALTLDAIAATVGCRPGTLQFTLAHPHLYEPHWDMTWACLENTWSGKDWRKENLYQQASVNWTDNCEPQLPGWSVDEILSNPDTYVDLVKRLAGRAAQNPWNPLPEVIE